MELPTSGPSSTARHDNRRLHMFTPSSTMFRKTAQTPCFTNIPRSRRLIASTRPPLQKDTVEEHDFEGLLQKTWRLFSLSPLYKFNRNKVSLSKYARSLDAALSQERTSDFNSMSGGSERSSFSIYSGLNFNENDAETIQIQIAERQESEKGSHIVLTAFLMCVDIESSPVPRQLNEHFTYYPIVMVCGNKARTNVLLNWLERHFDCRSSPVIFSDSDLRWMLALWSSQVAPVKNYPVLMQYSLGSEIEGINTIDCKFEAGFCKELWERIHGTASGRETLNQEEVDNFVKALEGHLEYTMHIFFSKLNLSEVGTSVAYVSSQGKLKLFSSSSVYLALHLICEIVNDKFLEIVVPGT